MVRIWFPAVCFPGSLYSLNHWYRMSVFQHIHHHIKHIFMVTLFVFRVNFQFYCRFIYFEMMRLPVPVGFARKPLWALWGHCIGVMVLIWVAGQSSSSWGLHVTDACCSGIQQWSTSTEMLTAPQGSLERKKLVEREVGDETDYIRQDML